MSAGARRELTRALRTSGIVPRPPTIVWGLDWVEVQPDPKKGFRLGIWFSCSEPLELPRGLALEDFSLETSSGQPAPGWVLSDLRLDSGHVTLHLSRSPALGPWTDAQLVLVYHGPLDAADNGSVDPLRDRHSLSFSEPAPPEDEPTTQPGGDQVVGDYAATRAGLLQRLALTAPQWQERGEADPWMALVDLLAWAGDQLAAYQDAVATEAWLTTARRRLSVQRHARLLGFTAHDGSSARAWLAVTPQHDYPMQVGFAFTSSPLADPGDPQVHVFHVLEPAALSPDLESIPLYSWGAPSWTLPLGTTQLALKGSPRLERGSLLLFPGQHVARIAQLEPAIDPLTNEAITRVELFAEDALPTELEAHGTCVSANLVLIGEGASTEFSEPPEIAVHGRLRYALRGRQLARLEPFAPERARQTGATHALRPAPESALPDLEVREQRPGGKLLHWQLRADLFESGPYDRHVVAELDDDVLQLRFGDGQQGRPAPPAALLRVVGRCVRPTNLETTAGTRLYPRDDSAPLGPVRIVRQRAAVEPISSSRVRLQAPAAARVPDVCRGAADYARYAKQVAGVLDAYSELRWSGSWFSARVWILPEASDVLGPELIEAVRERLERVRMLGIDVDVRAPRYVVGDVALAVDVVRRVPLTSVERTLRARLGTSSFFSRSQFLLGTSLPSGALVSAACAIDGVEQVRLSRFRREDDSGAAVRDWIAIAPDEVLRVGVGGAQPLALELSHA